MNIALLMNAVFSGSTFLFSTIKAFLDSITWKTYKKIKCDRKKEDIFLFASELHGAQMVYLYVLIQKVYWSLVWIRYTFQPAKQEQTFESTTHNHFP